MTGHDTPEERETPPEEVPPAEEVVTAEIVAAEPAFDLPDDPEQALDVLMGELASARTSAESYLDDLRRVAADFDNYRKRVDRDQAALVARSTERLVVELLPVLDSFDAAFTTEAQTPTEEKLLAGMRSTYHQLSDILAKEGLEIIPAVGEPFDPTVHEAVQVAPGADGDLVVTEELRRGYRLGDKVIRPAMVAVDGG